MSYNRKLKKFSKINKTELHDNYIFGYSATGVMITASLPVYVRENLVGVAAVDVTIEELFAEATYIVPGELSYSFVINEAGELLFRLHVLYKQVAQNAT